MILGISVVDLNQDSIIIKEHLAKPSHLHHGQETEGGNKQVPQSPSGVYPTDLRSCFFSFLPHKGFHQFLIVSPWGTAFYYMDLWGHSESNLQQCIHKSIFG